MPFYLFKHPDFEKVIEVFQNMKDEHVYVDPNGIEWNRIFTAPNAAVDTKIDATSSEDFVNKTRGKGMTMGQLWDESKTASEKRKKILGKDPIREKHFKKYSKKRKGMKHKEDPSLGS